MSSLFQEVQSFLRVLSPRVVYIILKNGYIPQQQISEGRPNINLQDIVSTIHRQIAKYKSFSKTTPGFDHNKIQEQFKSQCQNLNEFMQLEDMLTKFIQIIINLKDNTADSCLISLLFPNYFYKTNRNKLAAFFHRKLQLSGYYDSAWKGKFDEQIVVYLNEGNIQNIIDHIQSNWAISTNKFQLFIYILALAINNRIEEAVLVLFYVLQNHSVLKLKPQDIDKAHLINTCDNLNKRWKQNSSKYQELNKLVYLIYQRELSLIIFPQFQSPGINIANSEQQYYYQIMVELANHLLWESNQANQLNEMFFYYLLYLFNLIFPKSEKRYSFQDKLLSKQPNKLQHYTILIQLAYDMQQYQRAQILIQRAKQMNPQSYIFYNSAAMVYFKKQKYQETIEHTEIAMKIGKGMNKVGYYYAALAKMNLGQLDHCIYFHNKSMELNPLACNSLAGLGQVYLQKQNYIYSIQCFERAKIHFSEQIADKISFQQYVSQQIESIKRKIPAQIKLIHHLHSNSFQPFSKANLNDMHVLTFEQIDDELAESIRLCINGTLVVNFQNMALHVTKIQTTENIRKMIQVKQMLQANHMKEKQDKINRYYETILAIAKMYHCNNEFENSLQQFRLYFQYLSKAKFIHADLYHFLCLIQHSNELQEQGKKIIRKFEESSKDSIICQLFVACFYKLTKNTYHQTIFLRETNQLKQTIFQSKSTKNVKQISDSLISSYQLLKKRENCYLIELLYLQWVCGKFMQLQCTLLQLHKKYSTTNSRLQLFTFVYQTQIDCLKNQELKLKFCQLFTALMNTEESIKFYKLLSSCHPKLSFQYQGHIPKHNQIYSHEARLQLICRQFDSLSSKKANLETFAISKDNEADFLFLSNNLKKYTAISKYFHRQILREEERCYINFVKQYIVSLMKIQKIQNKYTQYLFILPEPKPHYSNQTIFPLQNEYTVITQLLVNQRQLFQSGIVSLINKYFKKSIVDFNKVFRLFIIALRQYLLKFIQQKYLNYLLAEYILDNMDYYGQVEEMQVLRRFKPFLLFFEGNRSLSQLLKLLKNNTSINNQQDYENQSSIHEYDALIQQKIKEQINLKAIQQDIEGDDNQIKDKSQSKIQAIHSFMKFKQASFIRKVTDHKFKDRLANMEIFSFVMLCQVALAYQQLSFLTIQLSDEQFFLEKYTGEKIATCKQEELGQYSQQISKVCQKMSNLLIENKDLLIIEKQKCKKQRLIRQSYAKQFQQISQLLLQNIKRTPQKKYERIKNSINKFLVSGKITLKKLAETITKMNPDIWNDQTHHFVQVNNLP